MWGLNTHVIGRGPDSHNIVCDVSLGACSVCLPSRPSRHESTRWVNSRAGETDIVISPSDIYASEIALGECQRRNRSCNTAGPKDAQYALYVSEGIAFARIRNGRPGQVFTVNSIINGEPYAREVRIQ